MPPTVKVVSGPLAPDAAVLAVPVRPGPVAGPGVGVLKRLGVDAAAVLASRDAKGEPGEIIEVPVARKGVDTVLLVGVGDESPASLRRAAAAMARRAKSAPSLATTLAGDVQVVAEAIGLASYAFRRTGKKPALKRVTMHVPDAQLRDARAAAKRAALTVEAVWLARDLAITPSLVKTPQWMVEQIDAVATANGLAMRVWDEHALAAEGFGGIVAVGRGSSRPPRLVELTYTPESSRGHVAIVGKGITFDSGGLSIKPLDNMTAMKTDMAGAAAVVATMSVLSRLRVGVTVTALLPLAENLPGADALRPSDVIRQYGGTTVEVLNTDAEGRLVLADALAYATAHLSPDVIVDLATLTGAATLGLGRRHAALYSTSESLGEALVAAGAAGGERLWPMPLVESYRDSLDSPVADLVNVGDPTAKYSGGSIVAALFLREFVGTTPWAHLDIAGTARADADEGEVTKGATGFGVRTLLRYLADYPV